MTPKIPRPPSPVPPVYGKCGQDRERWAARHDKAEAYPGSAKARAAGGLDQEPVTVWGATTESGHDGGTPAACAACGAPW